MQANTKEKALAPQQENYLAIKEVVRKIEPEIIALAGDSDDGKRISNLALSIIKNDPKLSIASPKSAAKAIRTCASLRLDPIGRGGVYLLPFENRRAGTMEVQTITDYRGEITLCVRSGFCLDIKPVLVCENDTFEVLEGSEQQIIHKPDYKNADKRGAECLVYAVALLADGESTTFEVLDRLEIERRRKKSKLKDSGPWKDDYWRMAMKSAVRAIANRLAKSSVPRDAKLARAYEAHMVREESFEFGGDEDLILEVDPEVEEPPKSATDDLADKLQRKRKVNEALTEDREPTMDELK